MSGDVNKVILIGNIGRDPEVRYMPNGSPVASFSMATNEAWKDRTTNITNERTEWHKIVCFGKLAEIANLYLRKGTKIYVEGSIRTRKWVDKNTQEPRQTTEIIAGELRILDSRQGGNTHGGDRTDRFTHSAHHATSAADQQSGSSETESGQQQQGDYTYGGGHHNDTYHNGGNGAAVPNDAKKDDFPKHDEIDDDDIPF